MRNAILILFLVYTSHFAFANEELIAIESAHSAQRTLDRLEQIAQQRGLKVFARIDHAAGAASVGQTLRPTQLLIFGHPKGGTPFMQCAQAVGLELPLKALAWEDAVGKSWLGYHDPVLVARRHGVPDCAAAQNLREALRKLVDEAVAR